MYGQHGFLEAHQLQVVEAGQVWSTAHQQVMKCFASEVGNLGVERHQARAQGLEGVGEAFVIEGEELSQVGKIAGDVVIPLEYWAKVAAFEALCACVLQKLVIICEESCCLFDIWQAQSISQRMQNHK